MSDNSTYTSNNGVLYTRTFAMPSPFPLSKNKKVQATILKYANMLTNGVVIDPFAASGEIKYKFSNNIEYISNDLNRKYNCDYNTDFIEFLNIFPRHILYKELLIISDPPYSPKQLKKLYDDIGKKWDGQSLAPKVVKEVIRIQPRFYISLGWNTAGPKDSYRLLEIIQFYHGGGRNDTTLAVWELAQTDLFNYNLSF